ncbi:hypothetical protein Acr_02g0004520 [Actinidia rufa]|uniref:Uncharacterized protein n=1 Tax=Actinidia rufa TaxID=165716 RepID=A0A7J0E7E1_9ERIC|nr:hypothetical protein Acr_02g0004520 [Actinidia rufa]
MSYRVKQRTPMKTGEMHIRLGLEAHHMRTHERCYSKRPNSGGRSEDRNYKNTYDERSQSVVQPTTSSNADSWACFDSPTVVKVAQAPSNANPLGLVLLELSVLASVAVQTAGILGTGGFPTTAPSGNSFGVPPVGMSILSFGGHMTVSPFGVGAPAAATTNYLTTFPSGGAPAAAPGSATTFPSNGGQ